MTTEEAKAIHDALQQATVTVTPAANVEGMHKCPRCWHWHTIQRNYDNLCDRCCKVLVEDFPDHESVPHIRAAMAAWRVETPEETAARFYDHTDDKYSLATRAARHEAVDSGNHDFI